MAPKRKPDTKAKKSPPHPNTDFESSVLRELKETIRLQSNEIASLKKEILDPSSRTGSAAGAGHGPPVNADDIASYLDETFLRVAMKRVGWLGLFLSSLSFTALIMNGFEHALSRQIELAYFVPLLVGHGGNTGGQTVGTILSALSTKTIQLSDAPRVVAKEALSGFTVGLVLGSILGPVSHYLMGISRHVSAVIFCTLPLVSFIAAALGSSIPFVCVRFGLDPTVIAAPAMTSAVDVAGLLSYFLIAKQIFILFGIEF